MLRKKIIITILTLALAMNCFPSYLGFAKDNGELSPYIAEAILGETVFKTGFKTIESGTSKKQTVVMRDGLYCWLLDRDKGEAQAYLNFAFNDEFKPIKNDGSVYEIEIEYFDVGKGWFKIQYDSYSGTHEAATVYMDNTLTWKSFKTCVSDAEFAHGINGMYDMRLCIIEKTEGTAISDSSIPIRKVRVERKPAVNLIYVSSHTDVSGNAYRWFDESKIIHNTFENLTGEAKNVSITYSMISEMGYKAYEKNEQILFEPYETKKIDLDFGGLDRCDIYWYIIEIKSEDGTVNSEFKQFPLAILKTDPDGKKNKSVYFASHIERYSESQWESGWDVMALSNTAGTRFDVNWQILEKTPGVLSWDGKTIKRAVESVIDRDMDLICLVTGSPTWYGGWNVMPTGDDRLEDWGKYCRYLGEVLGDYIDSYEIWNEPNHPSFNKYLSKTRGDAYVKLFEKASEEIKSVDPDAKIGGPSITGTDQTSGIVYYDETIENGLWKTADAITLHPYTIFPVEKGSMGNIIKQYKDKFIAAGGKTPEIWHTEMGYTLADSAVVTSRMQGALNARSYIYYSIRGLADKVVFYNFEKKGSILTDREHQFGFVGGGHINLKNYDTYYIPTQSYAMITAMNYVMADADPVSIHDSSDGSLYISKFRSRKFEKDLVTIYTKDGVKNITIDLGADKITMFDENGNESDIYGNNGIFTFTVDNYPKYLMGDISKVKVMEDNTKFIDYNAAKYSASANDDFVVKVYNNTEKNYSIDVETPMGIEVKKDSGFENGEAVLRFKNMLEKGSTAYITVSVIDGEKIVQQSTIEISSEEPLSTKFSAGLISNDDPNTWKGIIEIKNNSATRTFMGVANFVEPSTFNDIGALDIGIIPPGRTGIFEFMLPKITKKGQYYPQYEITVDNGETYSFADKIDFTIARYAKIKPTIDGVIKPGEWNMNTAMYADSIENIKEIPDWEGILDLSGKSIVMWDEENYYMCTIVKDDIHVNIADVDSTWNGDCVQFGVFYGEQGFVALGQATTTFHEISMAHSTLRGDTVAWRYLSQDNCYEAGPVADAECAITRGDGETYYEFKIPWNKLLRPGDKPRVGDKLGFSFLIHDSDAALREGWIEYAGGIGGAKDSSLFTYMTLLD